MKIRRRFTSPLVAIVAAGVFAAMASGTALATYTSVEPFYENPACSSLDSDWKEVKFDNWNSQLQNPPIEETDGTITVSITNATKNSFDWSATQDIAAVLVKGGPGGGAGLAYAYDGLDDTSDQGLRPMEHQNGGYHDISHVSFCYDPSSELEVKKHVVGGEPGDTFAFNLKCVYGGDTELDLDFTLGDAESFHASGLEDGWECTVAETASDAWVTTYTIVGQGSDIGRTVIFTVDGDSIIEFTNETVPDDPQPDLEIVKEVVGGEGGEMFSFVIECDPPVGDNLIEGFQLGNGQKYTLVDLLPGTVCGIREALDPGDPWIVTVIVDGGAPQPTNTTDVTLPAADSVVIVKFTNSYDGGVGPSGDPDPDPQGDPDPAPDPQGDPDPEPDDDTEVLGRSETPVGEPVLPRTGANLHKLAALGLVLFLAGIALTTAKRTLLAERS